MKRDVLTKMGLTDDQINAIMKTNGHDIENAKAGIGDVAGIKQENEQLRDQLTTRDQDMKALKQQLGDNEGLSQQVTALQAKYDQDTENLTAQLKQTQLDGALDAALTGAKARNTKAVRGLLDMSKVSLTDEGQLEGFEDQVAALKQSDGYLFNGGQQTHYEPNGGAGSQDENPTQVMIDAFKQQ
ncbi:phage scaffolding protein [Lactiplantibacillus herbarum]|uniref:phage scaffolding protein n=1 Tax=Lactiplantibacillus herbarum TaxID=1670446 RepID=UPI00064FE163|nr:phage scaffolding protein [Lactiplantibacillus herbarum]